MTQRTNKMHKSCLFLSNPNLFRLGKGDIECGAQPYPVFINLKKKKRITFRLLDIAS